MLDIEQIKKKNQEFFNKDQMHFYNVSTNPIQEFFNRKLTSSFTKFLKYIPEECMMNKWILDAGSDDGYFFDFYKAHGAKRIVGCDIAREKMLRGLKREYGILRDKNKILRIKELIQGDLEFMPLKSACFDSIFCFGTWHHIIRKDLFLKECCRVLKKNGFLIISDPNKSHPLRKIVDILGVKMKQPLEIEEHHTTPKFTEDTLTAYGFRQIKIYYYDVFCKVLSYFCNIILKHKRKFFYFFASILLPFSLIDLLLEKTILKIFPRFAWTYTIVCKNLGQTSLAD